MEGDKPKAYFYCKRCVKRRMHHWSQAKAYTNKDLKLYTGVYRCDRCGDPNMATAD